MLAVRRAGLPAGDRPGAGGKEAECRAIAGRVEFNSRPPTTLASGQEAVRSRNPTLASTAAAAAAAVRILNAC
jgi:hypothetical protein